MESSHIGYRIFNMSSNISNAVGNTGFGRVRTPNGQFGCTLVSSADFIYQPVLEIFGIDVDNLTDLSFFN